MAADIAREAAIAGRSYADAIAAASGGAEMFDPKTLLRVPWSKPGGFKLPEGSKSEPKAAIAALPQQLSLKRDDGLASISFCLAGGHLTSWVCKDEEQLFMSKKAVFVPGKTAIRGGIPICWPAFNDRNLPAGKHGIVRTSEKWVVEALGMEGKDPYVVLTHPTVFFEVDSATKAITGYHFEPPPSQAAVPASLSLKFSLLPSTLRLEMSVRNDGSSAFAFSTVLHSYFSVNKMPVTVKGLQGLSGFLDGKPFTDKEPAVAITGATETQRLYTGVHSSVTWETAAASFSSSNKKLTVRHQPLPFCLRSSLVHRIDAESRARSAD
jgi:D-hexose-6-phosphate mutarotase